MTLTISAQRSYVAGPPQIIVKVTGTTGAPAPIPNNTPITVTRIHDDGSRWALITEADPRISGGAWAWLDTLPPYNSAVRYEVKAAGATATSTATFCPSGKAWLLSPQKVALAFEIHGIKEIGDRTTTSRSGRFEPIGAEAVFLSDGRRSGITGSLILRVPVGREKVLRDLFANDSMVLINTPGTTGWDIGWMWVQPTNIVYSNPANLVSYAYRTVTVSFEQGGQPYADIVPLWTSGTALAYFLANGKPTSADIVSMYADSLALVTNTRI